MSFAYLNSNLAHKFRRLFGIGTVVLVWYLRIAYRNALEFQAEQVYIALKVSIYPYIYILYSPTHIRYCSVKFSIFKLRFALHLAYSVLIIRY